MHPNLASNVEAINKLNKADFIGEVHYSTSLANIVPIKKKYGQI